MPSSRGEHVVDADHDHEGVRRAEVPVMRQLQPTQEVLDTIAAHREREDAA
jgi:hypothetical protein